MKHANTRLAQLLTVALLAGGAALLWAAPAGSQSSNVPVDFESSGLPAAQLHFWRQGNNSCSPNATAAMGTASTPESLCQSRIRPPTVDDAVDPNSETRNIRATAPGPAQQQVNSSSVVRFALDTITNSTDNGLDAEAQGAQYGFTIPASSSALQIQFYYDTEAVCDEDTGGPQPIDFHIRFRKGTPENPLANSAFAQTVETACGTPGGDLNSGDANQVSARIGLDEPVTIRRGQIIVTEIFAVSQELQGTGDQGTNLQWSIFFQDDSRDSRISVRTTDGVVRNAVWTTDKSGSLRNIYDPNAATGERFLVPRLALLSPFGPEAIPAQGFTAEIEKPSGGPVDLVPGGAKQSSLAMDEERNLRERSGSLKLFKIRKPAGEDQPWHYPRGVESGSYEVHVDGEVIRSRSVSLSTNVAMGAFTFDLGPVDDESTDHQVKRGNSTTFLLQLENRGDRSHAFQVDAAFDFSEGGEPWSVDLGGVDQNDRVTVDPNATALLPVTVTPPEDVDLGDRARVRVTATSQASGSSSNVTLEAQATDQIVRDVAVLVLQDDRIPIGVDRTSTFRVFAWNQGTAADSVRANVVGDSEVTDQPDAFNATLAQRDHFGIAPGAVASLPVEVTTTDDVREGDTFDFDVRVQSKADPAASGRDTVETIVESERSLSVLGLDHQNGESLDSLRWSRINRTDNPGTSENECEGGIFPSNRPAECNDFANETYHRIMVKNTGDQTETVNFSLAPGGGEPGRITQVPQPGDDTCADILDARLDYDDVGIVSGIDHQAPGSESTIDSVEVAPGETRTVYLRVSYDGWTPYYQNLGPTTPDECDTETYHATVEASIPGDTKTVDTRTRFPHANTPGMPSDAQARLALEDRYVNDGRLVELPRFVGIEPGEPTTANFTLSLQQGHEDQANVSLASENLVQDLVDDGWGIRLVSLDVPADRFGPRTIRVPNETLLGPRANETIGHATGPDFKLGLEVTPPASGLQENERFTFTVLAESEEVSTETDTLGVGVQIGKDFDFELRSGNRTIDAHPGDEVAFSLGIENTGATRDGYDITTNASSTNVDVSAEPDDPRVSAGSRKVSSIRTTIPSSAQANTQVDVGASVTAERGTPDDADDDLGPRSVDYRVNIEPPSTLTMEAQSPVFSVAPGGQTAMNFSITNQKDTPQNLEISQVIGPPDWDTSLAGQNATRRIGGGETITQTVLIEAPDSIVEGSRFPFVVEAQNATDPTEFAVGLAEATVQGQTAVSLETERNETQVVDRGEVARFPLILRNPGTGPTEYGLRAAFESQGWSARFVAADDDRVLGNNSIRVPEDSFRRVLVEVSAPNNVDRSHVEGVTVTAFARAQRSVSDTASVQAEIHDFGVELEVTSATAKDAAPGDDVAFQLSITNTGNGEDEIQLSFRGEDSDEPLYPMSTSLADQTTPTLEAGETLRNVTVEVHVPSPRPGQSPIADEEGVTGVVSAVTGGQAPGGSRPTDTAEVTTRLVEFVVNDVDDDTAFEVALDLNRDLSDGYEVFRDQDDQLVERGELNTSQSVSSTGLHVVDGDDDGRAEHIVDTNDDGTGELYFDPDRARVYEIPYTVDVNDDAQAEHPIDANFDGLADGVYDPAADEVRKAVELDFSGDGRDDLLVDANGDTFFDRFVDPHRDPTLVTAVERDGDLYKLDTDGSGTVDTHYDVQTQSIEDAERANLGTFLSDYWYVLVVFLAVVVAFGVIFYRRL